MRLAAVAVALLLGACRPTVTPSPTPTITPLPTPTAVASASPGASNAQAVVVDASLRDVLPEDVAGLEITESPEAEAASIEDPSLAKFASALYAGLAVDPQTNEFVYVVVVRLREGQMGGERFRDWRDSYDEGACSQAGGVVGHAQAEINGRTVYIGTCDGGVRTYHVWLVEPNLLVAASAVGERRLGERLVEGLRP